MWDWIRNRWRREGNTPGPANAHLTFAQSAIGRTMSRTGLFLKRQLWIWPIVAVVLLTGVGFGVRMAIERTMTENLRSQIQSLLSVERAMLEKWLRLQESNAEALANDQEVRRLVSEILQASKGTAPPAATPSSENAAQGSLDDLRERLSQELAPGLSSHEFLSYLVTDRNMKIVASSEPTLIGQTATQYELFLSKALAKKSNVSPPFPSRTIQRDELGRERTGTPTMFAAAPVYDSSFQVVGAIAFRITPEREFTGIMQLGQMGKTGETYAIDRNGVMVSTSRFDEDLILLGLLPDTEGIRSILNIQVRDPGGNLKEGYRPTRRRAELPLTKAAAAAIAGQSGLDLAGYSDYRGVKVVGAWEWLPRYDMGIVVEMDHAEAFGPLTILKRTFYAVFSLLVLSALAIFVFTITVSRLRREAQKATIEAKQLGQYRLEEKLGEGAMGVVYRGTHAMLRRPTAIKLLNADRMSDTSVQRFEREVQTTCQLNSPHTVAIYDYGRTPEGVFYYAMEYLDGIDLQALVLRYGPQPEARIVRILKQVCRSLYEAHSLGLVHRDIKPANIMLNRRGGEPDFAKVLDFGLVKGMDDAKQKSQPGGGLTGTPLYMSPEAIQTPDQVDARSDLYAVGAVGYFLLTGQPVFDARSLVDLCQLHLTATPDAPSKRLGRAVSEEMEHALLACLEKNRSKRPQTARDLESLLDRVPATGWSVEDAETWWSRHDRSQAEGAAPSPASGSQAGLRNPTQTRHSAYDQTIDPE